MRKNVCYEEMFDFSSQIPTEVLEKYVDENSSELSTS